MTPSSLNLGDWVNFDVTGGRVCYKVETQVVNHQKEVNLEEECIFQKIEIEVEIINLDVIDVVRWELFHGNFQRTPTSKRNAHVAKEKEECEFRNNKRDS